MSHQTYNSSNWRCYICGKKSRQDWKACPARMVNARNVEVVVLHTVLNRILTSEYFLELLNKVQERFKDQEQLITQVKNTQAAIAKAEPAINNLLDALETQGIGSASVRLKEREAEKATLLAKLQELENKRTARELKVSKGRSSWSLRSGRAG